MSIVDERGKQGWSGRGFWGLVQQDGPWRATKMDIRNKAQAAPVLGGGLAAGGNEHAGHGNYFRLVNPYQQNGRKPYSGPSKYVTPSIIEPPKSLGVKNNHMQSVVGKPKLDVDVNVFLYGGDFNQNAETMLDHPQDEPMEQPLPLIDTSFSIEHRMIDTDPQSAGSTEMQSAKSEEIEAQMARYLESQTAKRKLSELKYPKYPARKKVEYDSESPKMQTAKRKLSELKYPAKKMKFDSPIEPYEDKNNIIDLVAPEPEQPKVETFKPPSDELKIDANIRIPTTNDFNSDEIERINDFHSDEIERIKEELANVNERATNLLNSSTTRRNKKPDSITRRQKRLDKVKFPPYPKENPTRKSARKPKNVNPTRKSAIKSLVSKENPKSETVVSATTRRNKKPDSITRRQKRLDKVKFPPYPKENPTRKSARKPKNVNPTRPPKRRAAEEAERRVRARIESPIKSLVSKENPKSETVVSATTRRNKKPDSITRRQKILDEVKFPPYPKENPTRKSARKPKNVNPTRKSARKPKKVDYKE